MKVAFKLAGLVFGAGLVIFIAGCGDTNNKTMMEGSAPGGLAPGTRAPNQDEYNQKARQQSNTAGNPYGKGS